MWFSHNFGAINNGTSGITTRDTYYGTLNDGTTDLSTTIAELNVIDGDTSATSTTLVDADRVIVNDAGTMKQVALTDFETYFEGALDTLSNVTTVGALNSGSITSGFGSINNGDSAITTTGNVNAEIILKSGKLGTAIDQEYVGFETSDQVNETINNTKILTTKSTGVDVNGALTAIEI